MADYVSKVQIGSGEEVDIKDMTFLDRVYPVGSIYMSVNATNPGSILGGTWVAWGSGKVPIGVNPSDNDFNTAGKTGGNKTHSHTNPTTGGSSNANTGGTTLTAAQSGNQAQTITSGGMSAHALKTGTVDFRRWGLVGAPFIKSTGICTLEAPIAEAAKTFATGDTSTINNLSRLSLTIDIAHTHSVSVAAKNATTAHSHSMAHTHTQGNTGSSSNLPPYITCYMWRRTA